jgi:E3 ubiquitin-protein ligase TRIP12
VSLQRRKEILLDALTSKKIKHISSNQTPFATLVKKLQESFTRMESFEVITVTQNSDDSKRSSPSLLARQLRLRLVAGDDSDIPKNLHNIVVSIHAIATFQALHDYLRPRVSGLLSSSSRLSGMLAALAASGFVGGLPKPAAGSSGAGSSSADTSTQTVQRRRSQRLAKQAVGSSSNEDESPTEAENPSTSAAPEAPVSTTEAEAPVPANLTAPALSDTAVDSELHADFTDDEDIDAEVFDDEVDGDNTVSEKTVTVSVAEGTLNLLLYAVFCQLILFPDGSKIEAQTPDGTRVATPNTATKEGLFSMAHSALSTRGSYAAALKAKPTDWHLEFSMDDQVLPLDLTIYGAIHQHEMRKKTGSTPLSMIWQGVYTIKFKKVAGPAPGPESRFQLKLP